MATHSDNLEPDLLRMEGAVTITRQPGGDEISRNALQPGVIAAQQGRVTSLGMSLAALELELYRCELPFVLW